MTGASRGIGAQIAEDFAACGAHLLVTATTTDFREELIDKFGASTIFLEADFSDPESTSRFLRELHRLPRVDVCVNNAGISRHQGLDEISEENWDLTNQVNLKAPFLLTQAVVT